MGNTYFQEEEDKREIRSLVEKHQGLSRYLSHHIRNAIMQIDMGIADGNFTEIADARNHIIDDISEVGL